MDHNWVVALAVLTLRGAYGDGLGDGGQFAASGHHIVEFRTSYYNIKNEWTMLLAWHLFIY